MSINDKDKKIIAQAWLWRNGNVLCLDNIEISKKIKVVDFFNVYEQFADAIVEESRKYEGEESISNVLIGGDATGNKYKGVGKYTCYVKNVISNHPKAIYPMNLVSPIEEGLYSDAKNYQWLIKGKGDFSLYQSSYGYMDERQEIIEYDTNKKDDWDLIKLLNRKVNSLRPMASEYDDKLDIRSYSKVYCGEDFCILIDKKGNIEKYIQSNDSRAYKEMENIIKNLNKKTK